MIKRCLESTLKYGGRVSSLINKKFDSEPVYGNNNKY